MSNPEQAQTPEPKKAASKRTRIGALPVFRFVRAGAATAAVLTAFGLVALRASYARANDAAMNFGDELLHLGERNPSGVVPGNFYNLNINGQPATTANGFTRHSVHEVLSYFKTQCDEHAQGLPDKFANIDTALVDMDASSGAPGFATIKNDQGDQGFVFCAAPDKPLSTDEQISRIKQLTLTGDLGILGDIRYVAVRKVEGGTHVVAAWTHGAFNVYAMFPKTGDAPGQDFVSAPRPDGARRIFTGQVEGAPYGANVYQMKGDPGEALAAVDAKLKGAGWKEVPIYKAIPKVGRAYSLGQDLDIIVTANKASATDSSITYVVSQMASVAR